MVARCCRECDRWVACLTAASGTQTASLRFFTPRDGLRQGTLSHLRQDRGRDPILSGRASPLGQTPDWLPAVEQFGEGFFLQFAPEALVAWLSQPGLLERAGQLQAGATAWINQKRSRGEKVSENSFRERGRPEYILAHSLAHALMSEVALDCGYPASALKERLYVPPRLPGQPTQCGILIYTAAAGNQGTLGGLVEVTRRFIRLLKSALERERSVPAIRSARATIRRSPMTIEHCMARPAMDACWSQKRAAKLEIFFWIVP
jgi:hypothetical protein